MKFKKDKVVFGRGQRLRKPSSKGRQYKLSQIKDKRQRLYFRLLSKSGTIEDLLYSSKNKVAVEEELTQFNDILKLVVARHEDCKQYHSIIITQTYDIEIGMLIEANCMKAMEPLKITLSKDGGRYVYQTKLGWCITGPIQKTGHQNSLKCNIVSVNDVPTGKLARRHFHIENAGKDMSVKRTFEHMYYNNFNEKRTQIGMIDGNIEQLSKNDKRFLVILLHTQRRMGITMRYHFHSNKKVPKYQIKEVEL